MKGLTHFSVGVAVASCFPGAVAAGAMGNPLYFMLGGIFGLLPDTIDFKFYRFFAGHDIEIIPDPLKPDPQMIANAMAFAVNQAHVTGKTTAVKLNTIRLGTNLWQQYRLRFDVPAGQVVVTYGPIVDTGRVAVLDAAPGKGETQHRHEQLRAVAPLMCDVKLDYQATTTVDILDGPLFHMAPTKDNRVTPRFIPWHRKWSHSLVVCLVPSLAGTAAWGPLAGIVVLCACLSHILLDQLGFMGSNLLFPFSTTRSQGLGLMHSNAVLPNLATIWGSCLVIFWNLCLALPPQPSHVGIPKLVFYGVAVPAAVLLALRRYVRIST